MKVVFSETIDDSSQVEDLQLIKKWLKEIEKRRKQNGSQQKGFRMGAAKHFRSTTSSNSNLLTKNQRKVLEGEQKNLKKNFEGLKKLEYQMSPQYQR